MDVKRDRHLEMILGKATAEPEGSGERTSSKPLMGVTFVDERGLPWSFQYSHLYRLYVEDRGDDRVLVAEFSAHKVTIAGRRLFAPAEDCLMLLLAEHKRPFVKAIAGGAARDFGGGDGEAVVSVEVEALKP